MASAGLAVSRIRSEDYLQNIFNNNNNNNLLDFNSKESIMVFLSVSGNMVPLRLFESESIESVKLKIQSFNKGFVVKNQKLVCGGRELSRSNSMVRDYGIIDGNVVHLVIRLSDLQTIHVRTSCGKNIVFDVAKFRDVRYVKRRIAENDNGFEFEDGCDELVCEGEGGVLLEDKQIVGDICGRSDGVIHLVVKKSVKLSSKRVDKRVDELCVEAGGGNGVGVGLEPVVVNCKAEIPEAIMEVMEESCQGMKMGNVSIRTSEGSGGAYLMQDSSGLEYVSVFKPIDEEPKAKNNPHGIPSTPDGEGLKRGTKVGEGAFREVAAYLLDHPIEGRRDGSGGGETMGFAGVPPTWLVSCLNKGFNHTNGVVSKIGSLQKFVKNDGSCEDIGSRGFPVEEVHKISVLDLRLANADRHAGNILYRKDSETGRIELIPIDHGYCLPECFEDCTFDWLYWPQARQPYSAETVEYIRSLDAEEDIALLKFYGWDLPVESARTLRISTMLLKKGVERGLTPYEIGSIMCRENIRRESVIEEIVKEALDSVLPCSSEAAFLETVSDIMDRRLEDIHG